VKIKSLKKKGKKEVYQNHIRTKILKWMVFLCIFQAITIGITTYLINSKTLIEMEKENIEELTGIVNKDIDSKIDAINDIAFDLAINQSLKDNLNQTNPLEISRAKEYIENLFSNKVITTSEISDICIIDKAGNIYTSNLLLKLPKGFEFSDFEDFSEVEKRNGGVVWLDNNNILRDFAENRYSRTPFCDYDISGASLIKSYAQKQDLGILFILIKKGFFKDLKYSSSKLNNIQLYLISPNKSKIINISETEGSLDQEILEKINTETKSSIFILEGTNKKWISYKINEATGWTFVAVSSITNIRKSFSFMLKIMIIVIMISIVISVYISWKSTQNITRGINEMVNKMEEVEGGNFDVKVDTKRNDEIGYLANGFNDMVERINQLIRTTYEQEILTKDAQFKTLQAQISPHFLYNTLDMLNWRLIESNQIELSNSIQALGQLLQYSLSSNSKETLRNEIKNVDCFVTLCKESKEIDYIKQIDERINLDMVLPKLTLQPIVENSFIHGFERRKKGNKLTLSISLKIQYIIIKIEDNGIGMEDEKTEFLLKNTLPDKENKSNHLGFNNIMKRLKIMFGENTSVKITSKFGLGTEVKIYIPKDKIIIKSEIKEK